MTTRTTTSLEDLVAERMQELRVPGVAVGLLHDGTEETFGFGVTSIEHPLPVTPETLFQIGSITKTFTATLLMQLAARGRLDFDAPIRSVLPEFRVQDDVASERATPRHLVTHTGGWIGDDFTDTGDGDDALARYVANIAGLPQMAPMGEVYSYCNSGFCVAGRLVEVLTGLTFERAARRMLLDPLGMERSFFMPSAVMTHRFAVGHLSPFAPEEIVKVLRPWPLARAAMAAGGLSSTVADMLKYARLHLGLLGDDVLEARSRGAMQQVWAPAGNFADEVGCAWMLRGAGDVRIVSHGGSTLGQQATLVLAPARSFAVVVLTNSTRGSALHERVAEWALERFAGIAVPVPTTRLLGAEELAEFCGEYDQPMAHIQLRAGDGGLVAEVTPKGGFPTKDSPPGPKPPPARFEFFDADRMYGLDGAFAGARAEFLRGPERRIAWLRLSGRIAARTGG